MSSIKRTPKLTAKEFEALYNMHKKLRPEDRIITSLQIVRLKAVDFICAIDKECDYIERCKEIRYKKRGKK